MAPKVGDSVMLDLAVEADDFGADDLIQVCSEFIAQTVKIDGARYRV